MATAVKKLIPLTEQIRLQTGSYESRMKKIHEAVESYFRSTLGTSIQVVATHPTHCVVMATGLCHRADFLESDAGDIRVVSADVLEVEALSPTQYIERCADEVATQFLEGASVSKALASLVPLVTADKLRDQLKLVEAVQSRIHSGTWKTLPNQGGALSKFLGEGVEWEATRSAPKYAHLYSGTLSEAQCRGYAQVVREDVSAVLSRLRGITESAVSAYTSVREVVETTKGSSPVVAVFETFSTSLFQDLKELLNAIERTLPTLEGVRALGKLRDVLAESVYDYDIASRFVVAVAGQLNESISQ
jgi:hypothetical protein